MSINSMGGSSGQTLDDLERGYESVTQRQIEFNLEFDMTQKAGPSGVYRGSTKIPVQLDRNEVIEVVAVQPLYNQLLNLTGTQVSTGRATIDTEFRVDKQVGFSTTESDFDDAVDTQDLRSGGGILTDLGRSSVGIDSLWRDRFQVTQTVEDEPNGVGSGGQYTSQLGSNAMINFRSELGHGPLVFEGDSYTYGVRFEFDKNFGGDSVRVVGACNCYTDTYEIDRTAVSNIEG